MLTAAPAPGAVGERPVIEAAALRRVYSTRTGWRRATTRHVEAVRGISFSVARGEAFGLLGPNGAGKTTTIKMLNTLLLPTSGSATVLGYDVASQPAQVRRHIGYVFGGDRGLYDRLSALDNLRYFAELYQVEPAVARQRIGQLLELVGLTGAERQRVENYSRGMRQRLHIARGLLSDPSVLFLDEPSLGLDPAAARELRALIRELCDRGTTVLLTTHYLAEADEVCDRVAVISGGVLQAMGTPADIKASVVSDVVLEVCAAGVSPAHCEALRAIPGMRSVHVEDSQDGPATISMIAAGDSNVHGPAIAALGDLWIVRVNTRQASLEDAYLMLLDRVPAAVDGP
jgi:ABC-2 type transport system ATP-binding protein